MSTSASGKVLGIQKIIVSKIKLLHLRPGAPEVTGSLPHLGFVLAITIASEHPPVDGGQRDHREQGL
jgi:hypothetical protein